MSPSDNPEVTRLIGDAKLCLLALEGDLLSEDTSDDGSADDDRPMLRVQLFEARQAIHRAGRLLAPEVLSRLSLEHITADHFMDGDHRLGSVFNQLVAEMGDLQAICEALIPTEDGGEDDLIEPIPSFFSQVERSRVQQVWVVVALLSIMAILMSHQFMTFPAYVTGLVHQTVNRACGGEAGCEEALSKAVPRCAAEHRNWSAVLSTLVGSGYSASDQKRRHAVRSWAAVVDCLNGAAEKPFLHYVPELDMVVNKAIFDAARQPERPSSR